METKNSVAFDAKTGEVLVCTNGHTERNHIYVGQDFHGNRKCCCGGEFLKRSLVDAYIKGQAKQREIDALRVR